MENSSKLVGRNEIICPCGQHFFAWRCSIKRGGGKYCCNECSSKYRTRPNYHEMRKKQWDDGKMDNRKKLYGDLNPSKRLEIRKKISFSVSKEKHWNWKGGITGRSYPKEFFTKLRDLIKERDKYQCQKCGYQGCKKDNKLITHHIDCNKKNCELNNLITWCRSCHAFEHNGK